MTAKKDPGLAVARYVQETGGLPPEVLIGSVSLFTIRDGQYDRAAIEAEVQRLGLDERLVPRPDQPVNAFKKAVSDANGFTYALANDRTATLLIRDVTQDGTGIVKHVVREIRDANRRRLGFEVIGMCAFYRPVTSGGRAVPGSERVNFTIDGAKLANRAEADAVKPFTQALTDGYHRYLNYLDDMKVRGMVRDYLRSLNSVLLKPGVWFTYSARSDEHALVHALVESLGNGSYMQRIPLIDVPEQRTAIVKAAEEESRKEIELITKEILEVGDRDSVSPKSYELLIAKLEEAKVRAREHTKRLSLAVVITEAAEEIAERHLADVRDKMLAGQR